ncbi:cell division protein PerM [Leifsonia poae]|uniref:cell division protein PerM n=1 Tax=Leifsonia poae TaxID=110933 RepID=UPI003D665E55
MNRTTVALLAALEAAIVVAIGLAICLVPLTILWATQFHLAADWFTFWRAGADIWLVGHGVNLTVVLDAQLGASLGLPTATVPFQITIAALGFAFLTAGLGVRTGMRAGETPYRATGAVAAVLTFAALAALVTLTASSAPVRPSLWQGIVLPPFVYALGVAGGLGFAALRSRSRGGSAAEGATRTGEARRRLPRRARQPQRPGQPEPRPPRRPEHRPAKPRRQPQPPLLCDAGSTSSR